MSSLPNITSPPSPSTFPSNTTFVTRSGTALFLGSTPYLIAGPNIYWLGIDENDPPGSITYPSRQRVLEIYATAYAMGANTVRATTLGVSVGCAQCVMPSLGVVNEQALEVIDFAVWAARLYGLRLVIPFVDQYEYYHGGIFSFLQFHNLSTSDYSPFYDTTSAVYGTFLSYISTILNHTNPFTQIPLSQDPTILAWESGNELGGWGGNQAPAAWTAAVAQYVKNTLHAKQLFIDGSYGVNRDALSIAEVDMYSNHYYPPYVSKLSSDASLVSSAGKVLFAGEFDWLSHGSSPRMWALVAAPALLALAVLVLPRRWFPWPIRYGCLKRRKGRRGQVGEGGAPDDPGAREAVSEAEATGYESGLGESASDGMGDIGSVGGAEPLKRPRFPTRPTYKRCDTERTERWRLFEDSVSASPTMGIQVLPVGSARPVSAAPVQRPEYTPAPSYSLASLPRTPSLSTASPLYLEPKKKGKGRPFVREPDTFYFQKWHLSLSIFLLLTPAGALLLHFLLPSTITAFTAALTSTPGVAGGLYWSLFGHTDDCAAYVYHNDGYWLVYPGQGAFMSFRVGQLVPWERGVSGYGVSLFGSGGLPSVTCPQVVDLSGLPNITFPSSGGG